MTSADDLLAMRYALGVAENAEIKGIESRLDHDKGFAARVAHFDAVFSGLGTAIAEVKPPTGLWAKIEDAIDNVEKSPEARTVRGNDMAWEPFLPGVERKVLFVDERAQASGTLYRVAAGAVVINHGHAIIEECLILDGEIEVDGISLKAGDLHMAFPGQRHGPLTSRLGAIVYIRGDLHIQP